MPDNWKEFVVVEPSAEKVRQAWMTHKEYRETCATNGADIPVAEACCDEECFCSQNVPEVFNAELQNVWACELPQTECHGVNVLEEASTITTCSRNDTYGPPRDNHSRTAALWNAYLAGVGDRELDYRDHCWMMVLLKASRDVFFRQRDNLVDAAGYIRNIEMAENDEGR